MKRKKHMMLSTKLFRVYTVIYGILFSLVFLGIGLYIGINLNNKLRATQEQLIESMNKNVENFITEINDYSMTLVNYKPFKETVIKDLPQAKEKGQITSEYFKDLYLMAYKMIEKEYEVGVYTNDGYYIWLGNNYNVKRVSKYTGERFYRNYMPSGQFNVSHIKEHPLRDYVLNEKENTDYLSVIRTINIDNLFHKPQGFLEVHVPYEQLRKLFENTKNQSSDPLNVYIFDKTGTLIYGKDDKYQLQQFSNGEKIEIGRYRKGNERIYVSSFLSSNLYMVTVTPSVFINEALKQYVLVAIFIFVLFSIILTTINYKMAVKITTPLHAICEEVNQIDINKKDYAFTKIDTDIYEIYILKDTLWKMQSKLRNSLQEIIQLESYEVQSRLIALQSQIKPHFMYNTLMTIDALSQEHQHEQVSSVCQSLTSMLRYISSDKDEMVPLEQEVEHVDQYLTIMQERFPEIELTWNIPMDMMDIKVPKLILQPLVENSLKYKQGREIKITIDGYMDDGQWVLKVIDNGVGFTKESKDMVMALCQELADDYRHVSLEIDGMGLPNIYIRLHLLYGHQMTFIIYDDLDTGSCIEIGGAVVM